MKRRHSYTFILRSERELHLTKLQQETSKEVLSVINEPLRQDSGLHLLTKLKGNIYLSLFIFFLIKKICNIKKIAKNLWPTGFKIVKKN